MQLTLWPMITFTCQEVVQQDDIVDELERILRMNHIERVNRKECVPAVG